MGEGCPLRHLNVSGCHEIGNAGITAIARGCPQLTSLDVSVLQVSPCSIPLCGITCLWLCFLNVVGLTLVVVAVVVVVEFVKCVFVEANKPSLSVIHGSEISISRELEL